MCYCYKVANQGDSDEIAQFFSNEEEEEEGGGARPGTASSSRAAGTVFTGFGGQEREMSAMVSALTHVMAGEHTRGDGSSSRWGGESSHGGSGGGGVKREREEAPPEAAMRYFRGFGELGSMVHGEPSATPAAGDCDLQAL